MSFAAGVLSSFGALCRRTNVIPRVRDVDPLSNISSIYSRAALSINVTGGQLPACACVVTSKP